MIGLTEASAAISSIKAAFDIMRGLNAIGDEAEVNAAILEVQRNLLEAQAESFKDRELISALANRIRELESQLAKFNAWETDKARYVLSVSPLGAYTYNLKAECGEGEVFHRLCVNCFDQGIKSVLHTKAKHNGGEIVVCQRCKSDTVLSSFENRIVSVPRNRRW